MTLVQAIPKTVFKHNSSILAAWFFEASPQPHPLWHHYLMTIITLSDIPGMPPAKKVSPEMTHELLLVALDPEPRPVFDKPKTMRILEPVNYARQFVASDDKAEDVGLIVAMYLRDGQMLFETQGISGGKELNDQRFETAYQRNIIISQLTAPLDRLF